MQSRSNVEGPSRYFLAFVFSAWKGDYMHKIRFTYTSTEIEPSVFLLLFFRMVGIYVYERFFDSTEDDQRELLQVLDEDDSRGRVVWDDFDLDLYYVQNCEEIARARIFCDIAGNSKKLFILSKEVYETAEKQLIPNLAYTHFKQQFLTDLLNSINELNIIDSVTKKQLSACGAIYCHNNTCSLTLKSKYFYAAEDNEVFDIFKNQYKSIIDELKHELYASGSVWRSDDSLYIQYSILNIAYEGNQYCYKNRKPMWYSSRELADICQSLLNTVAIDKKMHNCLNLLLAQIYSDLLSDPNVAYQYFESACENYNAYAYFKIGCYWQDYAGDYEKAIEYYSHSVAIYPEYYRAWYRMGNCYMETARCEKAIGVFQNVAKILEPRQDKDCLRPMEIEYLFKAHNQCGYVWNKIFRRTVNSLMENYKAVEAWNAIERSVFFDRILEEQETDGPIRTRTQNELNINKIYYEIAKLNDKMKSTQV